VKFHLNIVGQDQCGVTEIEVSMPPTKFDWSIKKLVQTSYICDLQFLIDYNFNTILLFQFAQVKIVCDTIDIIIPLKFIILELLLLFCVLNITYKYKGFFCQKKTLVE